MFIDSHCHVNLLGEQSENFSISKIDPFIRAAKHAQIERILCVGIDCNPTDAQNMRALADAYPGYIWLSAGLHPNDVPQTTDPDTQATIYQQLLDQASHPAVVAIGETGLDAYRDPNNLSNQIEYFKLQIQLSNTLKKPLIVHTRAARQETIQVLKSEPNQGGVLHCFTENWDMAKQALDLGWYISFSGIITFRNSQDLQAVAKKVPLDRILIETDAPFLAPVPYRGKSNQPAWVTEVAAYLAQLKNQSIDDIATQTTANFYRLFQPNTI